MIRLTGSAASKRDEIMQALLDRNISTRRAIMAIHRESPYCIGNPDSQLPHTCTVADTGIILPLFHQMTDWEHDYVMEALHEVHA
jgi:dTDP-4-amino-4,6-dideoxygalactose transaminase